MPVVRLLTCMCLVLAAAGCFSCFETDEDLDTALTRWREAAADSGGTSGYTRLVAQCPDENIVFLRFHGIDSGDTRFFDATTGEHIGTSCYYAIPPVQRDSSVERICPEGIVTEVICDPGVGYQVGDVITP